MCSAGIVSSAGVGRTISELITHGKTWNDSSMFDVRRLSKTVNNKFYLRNQIPWILRSHYELAYPRMSVDSCRNVMNSPLHGLLDQQGVVWGEKGNWEVPLYFKETNGKKINIKVYFFFNNINIFYIYVINIFIFINIFYFYFGSTRTIFLFFSRC